MAKPELIDTHAHLQWDSFDADRDEVVARAAQAGVTAIITLATDLASSREVLRLAEKYALVFAAVGIHPTEVQDAKEQDLQEIRELAAHPKVVAIGETGMDFYWDQSTAAIQEHFFLAQMRLAAELDLPVVIHNRAAGPAILQVLEKAGELPLRGVFHCFGEDPAYAEMVLGRGFHISFTGNITYKRSELPAVSTAVPLDRLLLETDSPFLAPAPKRGKRNEPAHIVHIAEKHAELRGVALAEIGRRTSENAKKLFRLQEQQQENSAEPRNPAER